LIPALLNNPPTNPNPKSIKFQTLLTFITIIITLRTSYYFLTSYLADITYAKANTQDQQNQLTSAYDNISLSLGYRPDEPLYHSLAAQILAKKALISHQESQSNVPSYISQAESHINQATSISPANINLLKQKAQVYYYLSAIDIKYLPHSITALIQASKLAPTDAKAQYTIGKFWEAASNLEEAQKAYEQAIVLKPNYDHAYFAAAQIYLNQKNFTKAKDYFQKTLQIAPANTEAKEYLNKIK
jgi:tetratricopeptide (TPR) repeat protein